MTLIEQFLKDKEPLKEVSYSVKTFDGKTKGPTNDPQRAYLAVKNHGDVIIVNESTIRDNKLEERFAASIEWGFKQPGQDWKRPGKSAEDLINFVTKQVKAGRQEYIGTMIGPVPGAGTPGMDLGIA